VEAAAKRWQPRALRSPFARELLTIPVCSSTPRCSSRPTSSTMSQTKPYFQKSRAQRGQDRRAWWSQRGALLDAK